jgi:hypothetical protein
MPRVGFGRIARLVLVLCLGGIIAASPAAAVTLTLTDPPSIEPNGYSIIATDDQGAGNPVATVRVEVVRNGALVESASGETTAHSGIRLSPGDTINVYTTSAAVPAQPARSYTYDGQLEPTTRCIGSATVSGSQPANRDAPGPVVELAGPGGRAFGTVESSPVAFKATFARTLGFGDSVFLYLNARTPSGGPGALLRVGRPAVPCAPELPSQPTFSFPPPAPPTPPQGDSTRPSLSLAGLPRSVRASRTGVVRLKLGKVNERVSGRLTLRTAKKVKRPPRKVITLAKRSFAAATGKTIAVKVRLSASNRRLLKKLGSVRVKATVRLADAAGNTSVRAYRFTLKAG